MRPKVPKHNRMRGTKGNPKSAEHKRFEYWLKERPCQVPGCHRMATEAHHAPFLSQGGTHDRRVGLCSPHHNENPGGVHHMSREDGDKLMGRDIQELAKENWEWFKCSR